MERNGKLAILKISLAVMLVGALALLPLTSIVREQEEEKVRAAVSTGGDGGTNDKTRAQALEGYGRLPRIFEANIGQSDPQVKFLSRSRGASLFLTADEAVLALAKEEQATALRMKLIGANSGAAINGVGPLAGRSNYFIGSDRSKWRAGAPHYEKVAYENIYEGIDLVYYGKQRQMEYDFVLAPGSKAEKIRLAFTGADKIYLDKDENLVLDTPLGQVVHNKPFAYQEREGVKEEVAARFVINEKDEVGFMVGAYDETRPLVIDPVLIYSTYLGGFDTDEAQDVAVDSSGNVYITGHTKSINFPVNGSYDNTMNGLEDLFITKLDASGSAIVYSTFLGGSGTDYSEAIAVGVGGNAYIYGYTYSDNYPTTTGAFDQSFNGEADLFLTRVNSEGTGLVYSTYIGGSSSEYFGDLMVANGTAYITGTTYSLNFPCTTGAYDTTPDANGDGFVVRVANDGRSLVYGTFLGGSDSDFLYGLYVDSNGYACVSGATTSVDFPVVRAHQGFHRGGLDATVTRVNATGTALIYSTFLGGSSGDYALDIVVDGAGSIYVTGQTSSINFPTTDGAFDTTHNGAVDSYVTKFGPQGAVLMWSTFVGGSGLEQFSSIDLDHAVNVYVTGTTDSSNFPTTPGAFDRTINGGFDTTVVKIASDGSSLLYSTFFGGSSTDQGLNLVERDANFYIVGRTTSSNFPTTPGAFDRSYNSIYSDTFDGFLIKFTIN